jgi:hypothetical protein
MGCFWHCLNYCELSKIMLQNKRFTWSNERVQPILVRLDRVFCNKDWELIFSDYMLQTLSSSLSDHCPIFLCPQSWVRVKDTFQFENFLATATRFP